MTPRSPRPRRPRRGAIASDAYSVEVSLDRRQLQSFALKLAPAAAAVANYCDHVEHNEDAEPEHVAAAADAARELAVEFAATANADIVALYAERLAAIEERNVLKRADSYDGHAAALAAMSWRDLQIVQSDHDRIYHPDVVGLAKNEQLRHYALHLTKIVGAFADAAEAAEILFRRLPDTMLFAIKLQTVIGRRLSDDRLPRRTTEELSANQFAETTVSRPSTPNSMRER
jgi:hypothetical protein